MGYFDYVENSKQLKEKKVEFFDTYAKISSWIALASFICFLISLILLCTLDIFKFFWFGAFSLVGSIANFVALIINSTTLKLAKKQKVHSYWGHFALSVNLFLMLLNLTTFVICMIAGYVM